MVQAGKQAGSQAEPKRNVPEPLRDYEAALRALTPLQRQMVLEYDGNVGRTAQRIGCSRQYVTRSLKQARVRAAIELRPTRSLDGVLTPQRRRELASQIAQDTKQRTQDRLRALELLLDEEREQKRGKKQHAAPPAITQVFAPPVQAETGGSNGCQDAKTQQ